MADLTVSKILFLACASVVLAIALSAVLDQPRRKRLDQRISSVGRVKGVPGDGMPGLDSIIRSGAQRHRWSVHDMIDTLLGIDRSLTAPVSIKLWHALVLGILTLGLMFWFLGVFVSMKPVVATVASLVAAVLVPRLAFAVAQGRVRGKLLNQFPDAIGLVVRAVRAGIPVADGIGEVARELAAPTGPEFKRIRDEVAIGVDLEAALWAAADRIRLPEYRFFVVTVVLQRETGGNLAEVLESLAETIRKRKALRERAHALSAEAKTSVYILAALPFVAGAGLFLLSRPYIVRLFTTPDGKMLLGLAMASLGLGLGTMHMMIRKALS